ncbi:MAG: DUF2007 domain-containing protein [Ignavibacteriae bacterium]|nr:DUF2007 domain-containing protein [Ignavibacteriota bacterium]
MEKYITIATFLNEVEAELAQATLAAAGIESFLKFEDTGGMMPVLQQSEGVKLLVDEKDVEEARIILTSEASEETPP